MRRVTLLERADLKDNPDDVENLLSTAEYTIIINKKPEEFL